MHYSTNSDHKTLATAACLINFAALEATQQLSGPIYMLLLYPRATTKRMCDNPSNNALVSSWSILKILKILKIRIRVLYAYFNIEKSAVIIRRGGRTSEPRKSQKAKANRTRPHAEGYEPRQKRTKPTPRATNLR